MGVESGEGLGQIVRRKEAERVGGNGQFGGYWQQSGPAVRDAARAQRGRLPVLFSVMLGKPKATDSAPEMIWRWTGWEDEPVAFKPSRRTPKLSVAAQRQRIAIMLSYVTPMRRSRSRAAESVLIQPGAVHYPAKCPAPRR